MRELVREFAGRLDTGRTGKGRRLYGSRLARRSAGAGGALPLSHRTLFTLYGGDRPDALWPSERAVRNGLEKVQSLLIALLSETALSPAEVRYRLPGQCK